jgi:SAM-dependent methyltransferase
MKSRAEWPIWQRGLYVFREEGFRGVLARMARQAGLLKHRVRPEPPDAIYGEGFFAGTRVANRYSAALADFLVAKYDPQSVLDVGCGDSLLLTALARQGVNSFGVDGSSAAVRAAPAEVFVFKSNLTEPLVLNRTFDLVCCIEVAEHLPRRFADVIVKSIAAHSKTWIMFSAAHPGQGGEDHLNEQPIEYWLKKFRAGSFNLDQVTTGLVREVLRTAAAPSYLLENLTVLRRFHA